MKRSLDTLRQGKMVSITFIEPREARKVHKRIKPLDAYKPTLIGSTLYLCFPDREQAMRFMDRLPSIRLMSR